MGLTLKRQSKADYLLPLLFFTATFVFLFRPVGAEQDFWWHLATGKWIWEHRALPETDPFGLFPSFRPNGSELLILKGYWLSQVIYYFLFRAGGLFAICLLGALSMTGTCLAVWGTVRQRLPTAHALVATAPLVMAFRFFSEHRPQLYSFLFFALLIYLLERAAANFESKGHLGAPVHIIPLTLILWVQLHPGYAIAFPLIIIYVIAIWSQASMNRKVIFHLGLLLLACIIAALTAPSGPQALRDIFAALLELVPGSPADRLALVTIDHNRPWSVSPFFGPWYWRLLSTFLALSLVAVFVAKKEIPRRFIFMTALYSIPAVISFRFGLFFFISAATVTGYFFNRITRGMRPHSEVLSARAAVICLAVTFLFSGIRTGVFASGTYSPSLISDQAIKFLLGTKIPGGVATPYSWGGYLIWNLWPEYRIFTDQRGLGGEQGLERHERVAFLSETEQLDMMGINAVVFNPLDPVSGSVYYGFLTLMESNGWSLAYYDELAAVFVRSSLGLPLPSYNKADLLQQMIAALVKWEEKSPGDPTPHLLLGQTRFWQGDFPAAEKCFSTAAALDRGDSRALRWLSAVKTAESSRTGKE